MRWLLLGAGIAIVWGIPIAAMVAWNHAAHKLPVPGEEGEPPHPAASHSPDRRRPPLAPGHIPPPPTSHSCGGTARLIDIRRNGCIWIWRHGHGWQQAAVCIPSEADWDEWLNSLPLEDK